MNSVVYTDGSDSAPWTQAFRPMVRDVIVTKHLDLPVYISDYLVAFLAYWAERRDFKPEPTFAERYMLLRTLEEFKQFADQCLFCTSVLPGMGARRGIPDSYYSELGSSAYRTCATYNVNVKLFATLSVGFGLCQQIIADVVHHNLEDAGVQNLVFRDY